MGNRRDFIKEAMGAAAGVAFTSCGLLDAAHAQGQGEAKRRQVVVAGKRVKTVDVHAHCVIPEAMSLMGMKFSPAHLAITAADRTRVMDAQGIDVEALSINPVWYKLERDLAEKVIQVQNEKLAELCAATPDRFVAFASLALQHPDLAVQQLEYAVKKLNLRGAAIGGSVGDLEFANPKFNPVWAKAEELGVLLFIHPAGGRAGAELAAQRQWRAGKRHRQSARHHHCAFAPDFSGHARQIPRFEALRGARRRVSRVVRGSFRSRLPDLP